MSTPDPVKEFLKNIAPFESAYQWKVLSFIAIKDQEELTVLCAKISFFFDVPFNETEFSFETDTIIAGKITNRIVPDEIPDILNDAKAGIIKTEDHTLTLTMENSVTNSVFFPLYPQTSLIQNLNHSLNMNNPRIFGIRFFSGKPIYSLINTIHSHLDIELELKAANTPFDSFNEMAIFLGFQGLEIGSISIIEVLAFSPATIYPGSTIFNNELNIICHIAKTCDVQKIKIGIIGYKQNSKEIERYSVSGDNGLFHWISLTERHINFKEGTFKKNVEDYFAAKVYLSYSGILFHEWTLFDPKKSPNIRNNVFQWIDKDLQNLRKFLFDGDDTSFERGVYYLLSIHGFSIFYFGNVNEYKNGPDSIAFTSNNHIGVIECTLGLPDDKKLNQLFNRANLIKEDLGSLKTDVKTLPVIVLRKYRNEAQSTIDAAGKYEIAVITRDELEFLLDRSNFIPNSDILFFQAQQFIPKNPQLNNIRPSLESGI